MKNQNSGETISTAKQNVYDVDAKLSRLEWRGKKIGGEHSGIISLSSGKIYREDGKISGIFEIDIASISSTDLAGGWKEKLDGHLKSEDFFGVEKFPKATLEIMEAVPAGKEYRVNANLTIKGKTHPVEFSAGIKFEENTISAEGEVIIDRSKYDVRYGSKSFFANIGDKMIHDDFAVKFHIIATK
ncbi:MAG: YceI family protein [Bacteroidetes bacterium]|nr:YceI family protein [Bacteroidota bacterium]